MSRNEISAGLEIIKAMAEKSSLVLGSREIDSFRKSVRLSLGKTVQLGDRQPSRALAIELNWEFVEDLPARKEYQTALAGFFQSLSLRLGHPKPQQFLTLSGVPLEMEIHWPFRSIHTLDDFSVHVLVRVGSPWSNDANFSVVLSGVDKQEMGIPSLSPPVVERFVVNSIRIGVDQNRARFCRIGRHPENLQEIRMSLSLFDRPTPSDAEVRDFIKRKVYWLGFREGDDKTLVATVDPYDLSYLARPARRLEQFARLLGAEQVIDLDASGQYAHSTDKLLREANAYEENLAGIIGKAEAENERTLPNEQVRQPSSESSPSVSVPPQSDAAIEEVRLEQGRDQGLHSPGGERHDSMKARRGKRCEEIVDEIKRIRHMFLDDSMTWAEIRGQNPAFKIWTLAERLQGEDRELFDHPRRWETTVGYAERLLAKEYGRSHHTVRRWRKIYKGSVGTSS